MKIGRICAAAAVLGMLALPLTATVSWADTAARENQRPGTNEEAQVSERQRAAAEEQRARRAEDGERSADATDAAERRRQVSQRPAGAPDTGGGPAEWNATPAYAAGGTAAIAAAGAGTVLMLRRRRVNEQ